MQLGLESNVREAYANGTGTANLIDNVRITGNPTLGVKENSLERVQIYPNPSGGIFNVKLPTTNLIYDLEITDLAGKVLRKQTGTSGVNSLNLTKMTKGVYLLKITGAKNTVIQKLIIE